MANLLGYFYVKLGPFYRKENWGRDILLHRLAPLLLYSISLTTIGILWCRTFAPVERVLLFAMHCSNLSCGCQYFRCWFILRTWMVGRLYTLLIGREVHVSGKGKFSTLPHVIVAFAGVLVCSITVCMKDTCEVYAATTYRSFSTSNAIENTELDLCSGRC